MFSACVAKLFLTMSYGSFTRKKKQFSVLSGGSKFPVTYDP